MFSAITSTMQAAMSLSFHLNISMKLAEDKKLMGV